MKSFRSIAGLLLSFVTVFGFLANLAFAATPFYTAGTTGYDISYPQGTGPYPQQPYAFGIVGVTSGRAYNNNPYLTQEYAWAENATANGTVNATPPSLYMNLNAPVGSTTKGNTSTPIKCNKGDKICEAHNYGWNAAAESYLYAQNETPSVTSPMWWLDIETGNSWSSSKDINAATIQGAIAYLATQGVTTGIYSNASMWNSIIGNAATFAVPNWIGGNNSNFTTFCNSSFTGTGSAVYLVQYSLNGFDGDYACQ